MNKKTKLNEDVEMKIIKKLQQVTDKSTRDDYKITYKKLQT